VDGTGAVGSPRSGRLLRKATLLQEGIARSIAARLVRDPGRAENRLLAGRRVTGASGLLRLCHNPNIVV
jgi:hypothetical protein